jgi:hypothetical protein
MKKRDKTRFEKKKHKRRTLKLYVTWLRSVYVAPVRPGRMF